MRLTPTNQKEFKLVSSAEQKLRLFFEEHHHSVGSRKTQGSTCIILARRFLLEARRHTYGD